MLSTIVNRFKKAEYESTLSNVDNRRYSRIEKDFATIIIGTHEYVVKDWSQGGVFFEGFANGLNVGDHLPVTITFSLPTQNITMNHSIRIVRKRFDGIAASFDRLTPTARREFMRVMDGVITAGFGNTDSIL